ncbi:glycine cleavage system aminomethyltransferase GcvT [Nesterenkonia sp. E16_7]|uniref:glycine cleavage system aminomethyltransferase GcvT n=1 Tax=unclassified Nesterenkonia TaxID=2629769 RepID=UPI001A92E189|nr:MULTISPECIES: glycine cleavage system aminomethyltransferase GcvT [unclassified Nesterenkonia]MBO0594055.1 glycine cleavage system aminomethyltransferase GcvT [Nesterenkonia sp. E16_10]MBO0597501.1 glycine cleavage system aminomethyltransferase GcvT [Nesterenkonia sp. E16_7]
MRETALSAAHAELGASFTDFGGWKMPLKYSSELEEHHAVRTTAGLFDLSHMGEIRIVGPDAATFLNTALVGNLAAVKIGKAKYSLICREDGGILDDLIAYRIDEDEYLLVPNASNREVVAAALSERAAAGPGGAGFDVEVWDESEGISLIAVQGPAAQKIISSVVRANETFLVEELGYYAFTTVSIGGDEILLARTGYTGEDGFELFLPNEKAHALWLALLEAGSDDGLVPCGLACRDSLRLEAGMPLYGNELSTERVSFEAGLPVVSFSKAENFVGRAALEAAKAEGRGKTSGQRLVGLKGLGRRAGRGGYPVLAVEGEAAGETVGAVTSGLPSPTLGFPIAMAYVDVEHTEPGTRLDIDLRGKPQPFEVVPLPFYRRAR